MSSSASFAHSFSIESLPSDSIVAHLRYVERTPAVIALENGLILEGFAFGDLDVEASGEVVFNTAITGYQEVLTDPSYKGQILTFTYPHIGNYGINSYDGESQHMQAEGLIVREYSRGFSNWRAVLSLSEWMQECHVLGIEGIDTRALVRVLRSEGAMRGIITTAVPSTSEDAEALVSRVCALPSMEGLDLTGSVTTDKVYLWKSSAIENEPLLLSAGDFHSGTLLRVAALDFGIKRNILRRLAVYGCEVMVFPATTSADELRAYNPDGIFLSNGPGDPAAVGYAIEAIRSVVHDGIPTFGICLGHQLLALAFGATTYKMKFGHRGINHPVKNLLTGDIEITSQNHGFAVETASMPAELELTHVNLNDNTCAGFRHRTLPVFCVQYHPEASPGTHDSDYLFRQFVAAMQAYQQRRNSFVCSVG
jgi:carbamoyl-phosphate synthase small subunit